MEATTINTGVIPSTTASCKCLCVLSILTYNPYPSNNPKQHRAPPLQQRVEISHPECRVPFATMQPSSHFQLDSLLGSEADPSLPTAPRVPGPRDLLVNDIGEGIRNHMVRALNPRVRRPDFAYKSQLPGVRCQTCAANGQEVWVIPGRACGYCRTPAPSQ
jgi:hypothetical protein